MSDCPFCNPAADRLLLAEGSVYALRDAFPVSPGHALIVPKRHVASWFDATPEEQRALLGAIEPVRARIEHEHSPDGYNIGVNVGAAAGQTVMHLHVHVIPRYAGDVEDPRGGVRLAIPAKGNYLAAGQALERQPAVSESGASYSGSRPAGADLSPDLPHGRALVAGDDDRLIDHLKIHLAQALRADIAVAFVQRSGLDVLLPHVEDMLTRDNARVRLLTGDYLDVSDPDALSRLVDLAQEPRHDLSLRVFQARGIQSFHPKAYILHPHEAVAGVAFVGSSNLSRMALNDGVEWNFRVISSESREAFGDVVDAFEALWQHDATVPLDDEWIDSYRKHRRPTFAHGGSATAPDREIPASDETAEELEPPPEPWSIQQEALEALEASRAEGYRAGLVVMATGLGKTWLAAFDTDREEYSRILFVAHRDEILRQAMRTFRRVRPTAHLGLYTGTEKVPEADVLFASVQTLGKVRHLERFAPDHFDYIVVDEFHHASAATYRRLIEHFDPRFLLGLTATPERTDGGNLLALCQQNLVHRCDLTEGIERGQLAPFHYFGVPDDVDYQNIPWRSGRFDEAELTRAVATQRRAANALEQWRQHAGPGARTIAFCVSVRHADFMAEYFRDQGLRAVAVHSEASSAPRALSLERLEKGEVDILCAVDIFNEGVDLPRVDTVLMLRPTESRILFLQQLGRGLRKHEDKSHLTVVDYIGNHRSFLLKPRALLGLNEGHASIEQALQAYEARSLELPQGCEVTYDLEALDLLRGLIRLGGRDRLVSFYEGFREQHGVRPTALETYEEGMSPATARGSHGGWLRFVAAMGDLEPDERAALETAGDFLDSLETTQMTRSYKMLVLRALLNENALPGELPIDELVAAFRRVAGQSPVLARDVGQPLGDDIALRRHLEQNPIAAWTGGKGTRGTAHFAYEDARFRTLLTVPDDQRNAFQQMARELVDWRLAQYLDRPAVSGLGTDRITCRVSRNDRHPILFFDPPRERQPGIPEGWTSVTADGELLEANFVKVAVNVARRPGSEENVLPEILTRWFGPDAGRPGTRHRVEFVQHEDTWEVSPEGRRAGSESLELWRRYRREEIPPLFGDTYDYRWQRTGVVPTEKRVFLFVTLQKAGMAEEYRYQDHFESPQVFQWQSQNQTAQHHKRGQTYRHHSERGVEIHLFLRKQAKLPTGKAAPFIYCGPLEFMGWEGEKPITIRWRLGDAVPERLRTELQVPDTSASRT